MAPQSTRIQRLVNVSLLASCALILSYLESTVPLPVTLPGVKLGLGNVAVVVALYALDVRAAGGVALTKVVASGLLFGSPVMLAYSLGGTVLAFSGMLALKLVAKAGPVAVSMAAAVLHNTGQILVAALLLQNPSVLLSLAPLAVAACITGTLTGAVAAAALAPICGKDAATRMPKPQARLGLGRLAKALGRGRGKDEGSRVPPLHPLRNRRSAGSTSASTRTRAGNGSHATGGFGVYRPGASLAHRLDPRAKIVFAVLYFAAAYLASGLLQLTAVTVAAALCLAAADTSWQQARKSCLPFAWLLGFIIVFDALFAASGTVLWECGAVCLSTGGMAYGISSALRFLCVLLATSTLMATTSPTELTDGFSLLIAPLRRVGVRVEEAALVMGLTLRFIPLFSEELARLRTAQSARFADFESGGFARRVLALQPLATPLLAGALRRANALATSIEARAFGSTSKRTSLRAYRMSKRDWLALVAIALLLAACIML